MQKMAETEKYNSISNDELLNKLRKVFYSAETKTEYEEVIEITSVLIDRKFEKNLVYNTRGYALDFLGEPEEAIINYSKAIELSRTAWSYNSRGTVFTHLGKHAEAVEDYSKAIKLDPNEQMYYSNRAYDLRQMQKYSEAISDYTQLICLDSDNPDYYYNRGLLFGKEKKHEEALRDYSIAIELDPKEPVYCNAYGVILYNMEKYADAVDYFTKASKLTDDSENNDIALYLKNRGNSYRELGQFKKAYADYARANELIPEDSHIYFLRGFAKAKEGDFDSAFADITKSIQMDPTDSDYRKEFGDVFCMFNRYEDALAHYSAAIDLSPEDSDYYESRAKAYTALGKAKEAAEDIAEAAKLKANKENTIQKIDSKNTDDSKKINETATKIIRILRERASKKTATMKFIKQRNLLTDSKLGGIPFMEVDQEYPVDPTTGAKLYLLIQINLAEMPPLPDYPSEGILQVFVAADNNYGCDYDSKQESWRIIYHKDITHPMSRKSIIKMMPKYPTRFSALPLRNPESEYRIVFAEQDSLISDGDFRFDRIFTELCNDVLPSKLKGRKFFKLPNSILDDVLEEMCDDSSRIGGYPNIPDEDRRGTYIPENYELLLQIGSDYDNSGKEATMWGDCGIAHFFIDPEDLKKEDFSKVIYTWEGC